MQSESYSKQGGRVYTVALSFSLGGVTGDSRLRNGNMFRGQGEGGTRGPGQSGNDGGGGSRGFPG